MAQPKNALMHLNELKPGSTFEFLEPETSEDNQPVFVCEVQVSNIDQVNIYSGFFLSVWSHVSNLRCWIG